jgi:hypothetical protein
MPLIKIPKADLRAADVLSNVILDEITDTSRWSIHHRIVFEWDGKYYMAHYSEGATEMQDESPWEYETDVDCLEVESGYELRRTWLSVDRNKSAEIDYPALVTAATEFIAKVDSGHARSVSSYAAFKSALGEVTT